VRNVDVVRFTGRSFGADIENKYFSINNEAPTEPEASESRISLFLRRYFYGNSCPFFFFTVDAVKNELPLEIGNIKNPGRFISPLLP
jgi:hypothetical protein